MPTNNSLSATQPELNATVSASAGSGKTWLLVTRIIRLLLAGAAPGSILALTFTRKAAAEMHMRLHQRLYELAIADDRELPDLLTAIGADNNDETQQRARQLYEEILRSLHPVRLQTFHSFCQDILSSFPLEADITPGFELLEDTSLLEQQAWEALFAEATTAPDSQLSSDLDCLMQAGNGPFNTRTALSSLLRQRSDWWAYTENTRVPTQFAIEQLTQHLQLIDVGDPIKQFFNTDTINLLSEFTSLLRKHETKTNAEHANCIEFVIAQQNFDADLLKKLQSAFLTAAEIPRIRKQSKVQQKKMGVTGEERFLELHVTLCERLQQTIDIFARQRLHEINKAWYRAGDRFIEIFQRLKRELRVLDFTDLEWNCYRLLTNSDNALWVQYKIDQRIDHFLIDEFQDTNPTQWQLLTPLLEEIAANPEQRWRSVFLVGDEKQSIYSFRRANPALQSQASAWLHQNLNAEATPLDDSRRSSPAIIEFVNQVFKQDVVKTLMPDFSHHGTHLTTMPGEVCVTPLFETVATETEIETSTDLRNPLLIPRADSAPTTRSLEAAHIAEQIEALISKPVYIADADSNRPVDYGDIIILVRNRTHIAEYENALRQHNIPFVGCQRGTLLQNIEIKDLEKLLDTLITPFDNLAIAQVLKSPIFAASDDDLITLAKCDPKLNWYERLLALPQDKNTSAPLARAARLLPHWRALADTVPVHDLLDRIYSEANIAQRYAGSVIATDKQRVLANLQRFLELSLELDSGRYPSLSHFLHYLRSLRRPEAISPDEPLASQAESRVRLLTIHASKGLEAPVIFLADSNSSAQAKDAFTALVHWPADSHKPSLVQLLTSQSKTDHITAEIQRIKADAQSREQLNLLYVALTRARQYLFISGSKQSKKSDHHTKPTGWYSLIENAICEMTTVATDGCYHYAFGQDLVGTGKQPDVTETTTSQPIDNELLALLRKPIVNLPLTEKLIAPSKSRLKSDNFEYEIETGTSSDPLYGRARGIAIHHALDQLTQSNPVSAEHISQQLVSKTEFHNYHAELQLWIQEAIQTVQCEKFKSIFMPPKTSTSYNEMPLLYQSGDQMVMGYIDRLVIEETQILLIDYKTHEHANDDTVAGLATQYDDQMRLYRQGVQQLWPSHHITTGILFTACKQIVWQE